MYLYIKQHLGVLCGLAVLMSKRLVIASVAMGLVVLHIASQAIVSGQPLGCPFEDSPALLESSYPAYPDATELSRTLNRYGFMVSCIARSKFDGIQDAKGAALYLTNRGGFDVVFLPKPQTFDALRVIERRKNGRYIYSFRGSPRPASLMDGPRRTYFIKHSNKLFIVWDKQAAISLDKIVNSL